MWVFIPLQLKGLESFYRTVFIHSSIHGSEIFTDLTAVLKVHPDDGVAHLVYDTALKTAGGKVSAYRID